MSKKPKAPETDLLKRMKAINDKFPAAKRERATENPAPSARRKVLEIKGAGPDEHNRLGLSFDNAGMIVEYNNNTDKKLDAKTITKRLRDLFDRSSLTIEQKRLVLKQFDDELREVNPASSLHAERADRDEAVSVSKPAPETDSPELPARAPEQWADRPTGRAENPVSFIKRVYAPWIGQRLTRAHLRDLDLPLYNALATWTRRHGWPADLELPTRSEIVTRSLENADPHSIVEATRLVTAARMRKLRAG